MFISRRFYPEVIGGGQISALHIAKAVYDQGNHVIVVTFTNNKRVVKDNIDGVVIYRVPIPFLKKFSRLSNMDYMYYQIAKLSSKYIEKLNPDVLHLLNFESIPLASFYYKKKYKIPIIATVNGPTFGCFTQTARDYKNEICLKCKTGKRFLCSVDRWGVVLGSAFYSYSHWYMNMLKFSYKFVDRYFIVSNAMKPFLTTMGVPEDKLRLIHNPIEPTNKVKTNLKKKLKINKKIVLYAGRLSKLKGIHKTIKAMQYVDAVFLIVGEKRNYYDDLKKLVDDLELNDKVKFLGYIDSKKLDKYFSIADVSVLVEDFYESLSRFLLESMSYGIPIVANDIGGNKHIVDNKNGILLKTQDPKKVAQAINKILNKKFKNIETYNKRKIELNFSPKIIGMKLCKEYQELVNNNSLI